MAVPVFTQNRVLDYVLCLLLAAAVLFTMAAISFSCEKVTHHGQADPEDVYGAY